MWTYNAEVAKPKWLNKKNKSYIFDVPQFLFFCTVTNPLYQKGFTKRSKSAELRDCSKWKLERLTGMDQGHANPISAVLFSLHHQYSHLIQSIIAVICSFIG